MGPAEEKMWREKEDFTNFTAGSGVVLFIHSLAVSERCSCVLMKIKTTQNPARCLNFNSDQRK